MDFTCSCASAPAAFLSARAARLYASDRRILRARLVADWRRAFFADRVIGIFRRISKRNRPVYLTYMFTNAMMNLLFLFIGGDILLIMMTIELRRRTHLLWEKRICQGDVGAGRF